MYAARTEAWEGNLKQLMKRRRQKLCTVKLKSYERVRTSLVISRDPSIREPARYAPKHEEDVSVTCRGEGQHVETIEEEHCLNSSADDSVKRNSGRDALQNGQARSTDMNGAGIVTAQKRRRRRRRVAVGSNTNYSTLQQRRTGRRLISIEQFKLFKEDGRGMTIGRTAEVGTSMTCLSLVEKFKRSIRCLEWFISKLDQRW